MAKGPLSPEVVRLAMDVEALSVRGNHDHEVVRQRLLHMDARAVRSANARAAAAAAAAATTTTTTTVSASQYSDLHQQQLPLPTHMHRRIAMLLSSKEAAWLAQLPYFVRSEDLGAVFVHAGLQSALPLEHQDQWVMMTIRSLLPSGRATSR